jgi:cytochrome c oxidase cbb3-type subunit 2
MSRSGSFFTGLFACFALSFGVAVLAPHYQVGALVPSFKEEDGLISDVYPNAVSGNAANGRRVYISEGCQACHSQVVRGNESADIERGWGVRRTVARDYIFEEPPVLGASRLGPDLSNVGSEKWRNEPELDKVRPLKRDAAWQFHHLYHPTAVVKGSNMPSYTHLFEKKKISGQPSPDALVLAGALAPEAGFEIVPTADAKSLVAYLSSLNRSSPLKEAGAVAAAAPSKK